MRKARWHQPVKDAILAFGGALRRRTNAAAVVGVTGSNGKTTAVAAITQILAGRGPVCATENGYNNLGGVGTTLSRVRPEHRWVVVEAGLGRAGQLSRYSRLISPDVAVVTCVSPEHTDVLGSLDAVAREKESFLRGVRRGGAAVLNGSDARTAAMRPPAGVRTLRFGLTPEADVWADDVEWSRGEGLRFRLHAGGRSAAGRSQLWGEHWIHVLLAATTAAHALGVPIEECAERLAELPPQRGRLEPILLPNGALMLRDDCRGRELTLDAGLRTLAAAGARRRVLIAHAASWGSGEGPERTARLGRYVADRVDLAVFVGRWSDRAARSATETGMAHDCVHAFEGHVQAAAYLREHLREGDLVLLRGRKVEKMVRQMYLQFGEIGCELLECDRGPACDRCPQLAFRPAVRLPDSLVRAWGGPQGR